MYLVFTCMLGERYQKQVRSLLLYLFYIFQVLINSPVSQKSEFKLITIHNST